MDNMSSAAIADIVKKVIENIEKEEKCGGCSGKG